MAQILDGVVLSKQMRDMVSELCCQFEFKHGHAVCLGIVQVGENASSNSYVKNNIRLCAEAGIETQLYKFPDTVSQSEIESLIEKLNNDEKTSGILLQLPLPPSIDVVSISDKIAPHKDVDGLSSISAGNLYLGHPAFSPCTPAGALELIKSTKQEIVGKNAVVVGASNIVGKPMAMLLLREEATVTICHIKTKNLQEICKQADILVAAAGCAGLITKDFVKSGAIVVDIGINFKNNKLCGDVLFDEVSEVAGWISPVPGGSGPMTVTMLMFNTYAAAIEGKEKKSI